MAASLLKSPGFFSVFLPISTMLLFGWSLLIFLFPSPSVPVPILWCHHHLHVPQFLPFLSKFEVLIFLYAFFQFYSVVCRDSKVHNSACSLLFFFFFFFDYLKVWSSGRDKMICLHLKIPLESVRLILQDRFWFAHIPFGSMVKFQFLAQITVDLLPHPVVSSLTLFLCKFVAFVYYAISSFVSITT